MKQKKPKWPFVVINHFVVIISNYLIHNSKTAQ